MKKNERERERLEHNGYNNGARNDIQTTTSSAHLPIQFALSLQTRITDYTKLAIKQLKRQQQHFDAAATFSTSIHTAKERDFRQRTTGKLSVASTPGGGRQLNAIEWNRAETVAGDNENVCVCI